MEEHRAQDETGGNGRDITRAFDRALADVGISTQVYWCNSLTGRDCSRFLEKAPEIFKAMTSALQAKGIPDADIRGYLKKHQEPLSVLLKIVPLISAARLLTDNERNELGGSCVRGFVQRAPQGLVPAQSPCPCGARPGGGEAAWKPWPFQRKRL